MKFRLFFKSFNKEIINSVSNQVRSKLLSYECKVSGIVALPTRIKKFCVLRSPHIDKDSREHFEIRLYKQFLDITIDSPSIFNLLLKVDMPSGISSSIKILKNSN